MLEQIGESCIVHELSRHGILTLKPFFDRDGADLVVLSDTTPSARIGWYSASIDPLLEKGDRQSPCHVSTSMTTSSYFCMSRIPT
jgi:hypothetical protein